MRLLVTRPEPERDRTAALLRSRGHDVLQQSLLRIEPITNTELGAGPWAAVLFTSANAVRAVSVHPRFADVVRLPGYAVGERTKAAAVAAGFTRVISADGDVSALIQVIAADPAAKGRQFLYCAGEDRAGDLASALQKCGLHVETACVYRAETVTDLTPDVRAAFTDDAIDAVLHYSERTATAFVAAATAAGIRDLSIRARHLCLSAKVAAPLAAAGATAIDVAREPNEQALFALIASSLPAPARAEK